MRACELQIYKKKVEELRRVPLRGAGVRSHLRWNTYAATTGRACAGGCRPPQPRGALQPARLILPGDVRDWECTKVRDSSHVRKVRSDG